MSETINNGPTGANVATHGMCAWCDHTLTHASYNAGERKLKQANCH